MTNAVPTDAEMDAYATEFFAGSVLSAAATLSPDPYVVMLIGYTQNDTTAIIGPASDPRTDSGVMFEYTALIEAYGAIKLRKYSFAVPQITDFSTIAVDSTEQDALNDQGNWIAVP